MKTIINTRQGSLRRPAMALGLMLGVLLALGACGQLNDDPLGGSQLTFTVRVDPASESVTGAPVDSNNTYSIVSPPTLIEPVRTLLVGGIVLTHTNTPYADINTLSSADISNLVSDGQASASFMEMFDLPHAQDTVSFPIPPSDQGPVQIFAVGLRDNASSFGDVKHDSPHWFAVHPEFVNGQLRANAPIIDPNTGQTVELLLAPICSTAYIETNTSRGSSKDC